MIIPDLSVDFYAVFANEITYLLENMSLKWFYLIVVGTVVGDRKSDVTELAKQCDCSNCNSTFEDFAMEWN